MKVALAFPGCHRRGGVERVFLETANYMQRSGHDTHVYASDYDRRALDPSIALHPVAARSYPLLGRIFSFSRQSSIDVRSLNPAADVLGGFGVVSPPGGVVWVPSVHRAWIEISGQQRGFRGRLRQRLNPIHPALLALEERYYGQRRYRRLIALTDQVKADLMRFYRVPSGDIDVLPNGYSPSEFNLARRSEMRPAVRQRLGYAPEDRVVIFVANELQRKGFAPLLRAMASLRDSRLHLLAVGRLDATAYLPEIRRLNMTSRVQFTGPSGDVAAYYAAADLFALPTQYEAWGLVIVEAMACGLPVLTSRLAGAAKVVREDETGELLNDPRDVNEIATRLDTLLQGQHRPAEEISESVAPYTWDRILGRYESILQGVAANAQPGIAAV